MDSCKQYEQDTIPPHNNSFCNDAELDAFAQVPPIRSAGEPRLAFSKVTAIGITLSLSATAALTGVMLGQPDLDIWSRAGLGVLVLAAAAALVIRLTNHAEKTEQYAVKQTKPIILSSQPQVHEEVQAPLITVVVQEGVAAYSSASAMERDKVLTAAHNALLNMDISNSAPH